MSTVARAVLEIVTDASGVDPGINKVRGSISGLTGDLKSMAGTMGIAFGGAAIVSGIKSLITGTFEYAENITDLAQRMDVSTDAAQRWKYAADQNGSSIETFAKGASNLSKELAGGGKSVEASLKSAGLELRNIQQMKPEDAFNATVAAIARMPDPLQQVKVGTELFGKAWIEMAPAIKNGFIETANEASIMSKQTIKDLDNAKQAWDNFGNSITIWTGRSISLIGNLAEKSGDTMYRLSVLFTEGREGLRNYDAAAADLQRTQANANKTLEENETKARAAAASARDKARADAELEVRGKAAAAEQRRLTEAFQKQVDVLTGKALAREIATLNKEVAAAEKQGGLTAFQYKELGKKLDELMPKGVTLTSRLHDIWLAHERLNPSIRVTTDAYAILAQTMKGVESIRLMPPPPIPLTIGTIDVTQIGRQLGALPAGPEAESFGDRLGVAVSAGFRHALAGLGGIIVGALQSGEGVGRAVGVHLGAAIGDEIGKEIAKRVGGALGSFLGGLAGPIGSIIGSMVGGAVDSVIGRIIGRNDTKNEREQLAQMMGFSSLAAMNDALRAMGEDGNRLVHQGLNIIGRRDHAANQQWMREVEALINEQRRLANEGATAVEDAAEREVDAHKAVKAAIQEKIDTLDSERESVFQSIEDELNAPEYDEAGNRIYGVIEAQGIARLAEIDRQKEELSAQMAQASAKVMDQAVIVRDGIRELFKEPIKITFDLSGFPNLPGSNGGSTGAGGSGTTWSDFLGRTNQLANLRTSSAGSMGGAYLPSLSNNSQPIVLNATLVSKLNNRTVAREQVQVQGEVLRQLGG